MSSLVETGLALLVVVPMVGATLPLALGLVRDRVGWATATVVLAVEAALAARVAYALVLEGGRVVHVLGGETFGRTNREVGGESTEGFAVGIELVGDALSGLVVALVAGVALGVLAFARRSGPRTNAFYSGYLLLTGGLMGVALTGDLFNLFVFLEISGLATYALVASGRSPTSAVAALKYLVLGTTGASMYLVGVGYLFLRTGALNMVDVSRTLAGNVDLPGLEGALYGDPLVVAAFGFVAVGLATKAALFPLHTWQPDAYAEAPDTVTVYISALASTAAAYALARVTWFVFTPAFFEFGPNRRVLEFLLALATVSVLVGSALAAMQPRIKRMLAYSSVAQFGLIVIGIGVAVHPAAGEQATQFAVYGVGIHLVGHAVIKSGLFATAAALAADTGARRVQEYAGLARRRPFLAGGMATLAFGLVGVPPTVGFLGKWYIALAAVEAEHWPLVAVVFLSTVLSLLYVARVLESLYFAGSPEAATEPSGEIAGSPGETGDAVAADGGDDTDGVVATGGASTGMVALALTAAVLTVGLGFTGAELSTALDPVVEAVTDAAPSTEVSR